MMITLALASCLLAPAITTADFDGKPVTLPVPKHVTCLFFVGTECPIANRTAPEFNRIVADYKGVSFFFVYVDGGALADAVKHRKDFGFKAPGILDSHFQVAKFAKATVTPETALFDKTGALVYHGRINDAYTEHNLPRDKPSKNDLRDAIAATLKDQPVREPYIAPVGCYIPF
jgi:thiol-disulfide isomerase/thioredoxin